MTARYARVRRSQGNHQDLASHSDVRKKYRLKTRILSLRWSTAHLPVICPIQRRV